MRNILLTVSYEGTRYSGWQKQKNSWTLQAELEDAMQKAFGRGIRTTAASRTDAGVHAKGQAVNFQMPLKIPAVRVPRILNSFLPEDMAVLTAKEVPRGFNARFDALEKKYRYHILNTTKRDPFKGRYSWRYSYPLDVAVMKQESEVLLGKHDFKSFQASDKKERDSVRTITSIDIRKKGASILIDICGDGFLYNMVRNIVGTLADAGRGYLSPGSVGSILRKKDRTLAGPTAPGRGLFLLRVTYPKEKLLA